MTKNKNVLNIARMSINLNLVFCAWYKKSDSQASVFCSPASVVTFPPFGHQEKQVAVTIDHCQEKKKGKGKKKQA